MREWNNKLLGIPVPGSAQEARDMYFKSVSDEFVNYYFEVEVPD